MPHTENSRSPFTTAIAPIAWMQIALLPQDTYAALMQRLHSLVNLATSGRHPIPVQMKGADVETSLSFVVDDLAALYEADFQARVIRLQEVARRLPMNPCVAPDEAPERQGAGG